MADWAVWKLAYEKVTLRVDGDPTEMEGATNFNLDVTFPNYEVLWRRHVVPATNRPANWDHRQDVHPALAQMTMVSHGIFCDLVQAERNLARVKAGDYGGQRYHTCQATLKSGGDAMQKFEDFQVKKIEVGLSSVLSRTLQVWTKQDWKNIWKPRYDKLSAYRNFLTHTNSPFVAQIVQPGSQVIIPKVPHEDFFQSYRPLPWKDQESRFHSHPQEWDEYKNVCTRVHQETVKWLNDAYAEVIKTLDPLLPTDDYQFLWGWDTQKYGKISLRKSHPHLSSQPLMGSGGGFMPIAPMPATSGTTIHHAGSGMGPFSSS